MINTYPLISIIIPVYNHEKFVEEALNSVLLQTYPYLEVIIIDDGSKDRSPELVERWLTKLSSKEKGRDFTFIKQQNQGAHATINKGLNLAKGDLLTILNSDDVYTLDRLEKMTNRLREENRKLIFSGVRGIDENGQEISVAHPWRKGYEFTLASLTSLPTVGFQLMKSNLAMSTGNLLFTKELYHAVGEFKNLKLAHDYDFLIRALLLDEPIFLEEPLYLYRLHGNNSFSQMTHLLQKEVNEIYCHYLYEISKKPPINLQAPCHTYWPFTFPLIRSQMNMDQSLSYYLTQPTVTQLTKKEEAIQTHSSFSIKKEKVRKQKISLITHNLSLTGAPKVVVDLACQFKREGHAVNVVSLKDGPMKQQLEKEGISLYVLPKITSKGMFSQCSIVRRASSLFNSFLLLFRLNKIVIGNTSLVASFMTLLPALNPFYRFIWYIHDSLPPSFLLNISKMKGGLLNRAKENPKLEMWYGSDSTKNIWKSAGFKGTTKYWSGLSPSHFPKKPLHTPIKEILSVGTSSSRKGTYYLIEAFIRGVQEKVIPDEVNLTIIGFHEDVNEPDPSIGDLILRVVHSGVKDRIRLIPSLQPDQIEPFYQQTDLYVQSSILECLPIALFQAMAYGLPIITTAVNGCTEAIEDGKTGYVCYSRSHRSLLEAIVKSLNHPEKSRQMGMAAQKVFEEKFSLEKNYENIRSAIYTISNK
jgi:glycosyltransferase involved in cell wall biosynthesis